MDPLAQSVTALLSDPSQPPPREVQKVFKNISIEQLLTHFIATHPSMSLAPNLELMGWRWYLGFDTKEILFEMAIAVKKENPAAPGEQS